MLVQSIIPALHRLGAPGSLATNRKHEQGGLHLQDSRGSNTPSSHLPVCDPFFFQLDLMHVMDCKGVSAIVFGSILCWLIRLAALGANIEERLKKLNGTQGCLVPWQERRALAS